MLDIFNKDIITQEDIQSLLDMKVEESLSLEYKKANEISPDQPNKINRISVVISAFANTAGGILIYGIQSKRRKAYEYSFINGNKFTVDWFKSIIHPRIQRPIEGLKFHHVVFDDDLTKSVFVISIPESPDAPHMAFDKKFYKRSHFKEIVMEEYEVRLMYKKTNITELEFFGILNTNGVPILSGGRLVTMNFYPKFMIRNISNIVEHSYKFEISIPTAVYDETFKPLQQYFVKHEGVNSVFAIPNTSPLFQEEITTVIDANLYINRQNYKYFENGDIIVKLYYSNGLKTQRFNLKQTFHYKNKTINYEDFALTEEALPEMKKETKYLDEPEIDF